MKKRYRKYIKKVRKKIKVFKSWNLPILIISAFVALFIGISIFSLIVKAEVTNLYPGSCLGGWINTQNAQGKPSLDNGASSDLFNESNSAVLKNAIAQIFCGSFNGHIPQDNEPKKVFLKFSWNIIEEPAVLVASSTITIISESFASSTPNIIGEPSDQVEFILIAPEVATSSEPALPEEFAPSEEPVVPLEEIATSSPSSFWNIFTVSALAQEKNLETLFPSTVASSTVETLATSTPDVLDSGEFLEISYTLDSVNWTTLGRINRSNWRDVQFELPITNWTDIQKVQISVSSLSTVDEQPTIYLDGMWLEVLYGSENLTTAISGFFSIKRSDEKTVFISRLYNRSPSGDVIASPLTIKIYLEDFVNDTQGCNDWDYWGVAFRYKDELSQSDSKSKFVITPLLPNSIKTFDKNIDLPLGEIMQVSFSCWQENLDPNTQDYDAQENSIAGDLEIIDFETPIFKVVP